MVAVAQSGEIGKICSVSATCTMLRSADGREYDAAQGGGSITELSSYPLLAIIKLLGHGKIDSVSSKSIRHSKSGIDIFSRIDALINGALASGTVALGVKAEGDLVIAGTKGYIYVPAPWWLMRSFQLRFEDTGKRKDISTIMEGDGLRYELAEFIKMISEGRSESFNLTAKESCAIARCIELAGSECQTIGYQ
jgi:choline-phosphate cytidylyltransferase